MGNTVEVSGPLCIFPKDKCNDRKFLNENFNNINDSAIFINDIIIADDENKITLSLSDIISLYNQIKDQQKEIDELKKFKEEALPIILEYKAKSQWDQDLEKN